MDLSGRLGRLRSVLDRPGAGLRLAGRQVTDESQQAVARLNQFLKSRFLQAQILQEHGLLIVVQLRDLLLNLRADHEYLAAILRRVFPHRLHMGIGRAVVRQVVFLDIGCKNHRLAGQKVIARKPLLLILVVRREADGHLAILQPGLHPLQKIQLLRQRLVIAGAPHRLGNPSLQNLQI